MSCSLCSSSVLFCLQGFINKSFENIASTEHALNLLRQFQSILQRESLKASTCSCTNVRCYCL